MSLFGKKKNEVQIPENIIFEEFEKHRVENKLKVDSVCEKIQRDMQRFSNSDFAKTFSNEFYYFNLDLLSYMFEKTNSDTFTKNLVTITNAVKWYALNYSAGENGKSENEIKNTVLNLVDLFDVMVFIALDHLIFEKGIYAKWEDDEFFHEENEYASQLICMVIEVMNNIVCLTDAVYDRDDYGVINAYNNLKNMDTFQVKPATEDIFEL